MAIRNFTMSEKKKKSHLSLLLLNRYFCIVLGSGDIGENKTKQNKKTPKTLASLLSC
jgi:hypothetical protein